MTAKQKIGYKVLSRERESIVMITGLGWPGRKYLKRKKIKPKRGCGPLCVFDSLITAQNWTLENLILKCKYIPSKHKSVWDEQGKRRLVLPKGTILADSVTCLE